MEEINQAAGIPSLLRFYLLSVLRLFFFFSHQNGILNPLSVYLFLSGIIHCLSNSKKNYFDSLVQSTNSLLTDFYILIFEVRATLTSLSF